MTAKLLRKEKMRHDTRYKIQETLFNVGYSKTVNISYKLFSDKHEYKNNSK